MKPGYHLSKIERGTYGELSKVQEELNEALDAMDQGCKIMLQVELADIYGALEAVAVMNGLDMEDLKSMSDITKRAFDNGARS